MGKDTTPEPYRVIPHLSHVVPTPPSGSASLTR